MCAQIAGLQDFRGEGPPGDMGVFQGAASIIVYPFTFSGITYYVAQRMGVQGWILVAPPSTVAATVWQAALNLRGEIYFKGDYTITSPLIVYPGTKITTSGRGSVNVQYTDAANDMFTIGLAGPPSYAATTHLLAADTALGSVTVTLVGGAGANYAAGDWIKISDDYAITTLKAGEIIRIKSVVGDVLTLEKKTIDDFTTALNAKVRKITLANNVIIEGLVVTGPGIETAAYMLTSWATRGVLIRDCWLKTWGEGISFRDSLDCTIENSIFENIFTTELGYSIITTNACDNVLVTGCSFRQYGRHYFATGAGTGTYISDGWPKNLKIHDCHFENTQTGQEAVNTHEPFYGPLIITASSFVGCGKGVEIQTGGLVMNGCTFDQNIIDLHLIGTTGNPRHFEINGCLFQSMVNIVASNTEITGCSFQGGYIVIDPSVNNTNIFNNVWYGASSAAFQPIAASGGSGTEVKHLSIRGNTFKDVSTTGAQAIKLIRCWYVDITDNYIINSPDVATEFQYCDHVDLFDNHVDNPTYHAFRFTINNTHLNIVGNVVTRSTYRGVSLENNAVDTATVCLIRNNYFSCSTPIYNDGTYVATKICDNQGYNPVGNIATPYSVAAGYLSDVAGAQAFPTSAVDYTVSSSPKLITIYGGTITSVSIGGVATGQAGAATFAAYRLEPGQILNVVWVAQPSSVIYAC